MLPLKVNEQGRIVDCSGKSVSLRGANTAGLEYGNATSDFTQARINAVTSLMHLNLWRVAINTSWWLKNVLLLDGKTHYQDWIQTVIGWMLAANCYVEIDAGPSFGTLPGNPGPSQDTQDACNNTEAKQIHSHVAFWKSIVPIYLHNPAILYNVMNEPTYDDNLVQMQTLINTIQTIKYDATCIIYNYGYSEVVAGNAPDYTGSNLILDFHIYDDPTNTWQTKFSNRASMWDFAQSKGHGVMIGEFNIRTDNDPNGYAQNVANVAITRGAAVAYYQEQNLVQNDNATLSTEGQIVASAFQGIENYTPPSWVPRLLGGPIQR